MKEEKEEILEPEVTPEMVAAGEEVLDVLGERLAPSLLAERVYIAMRKLESVPSGSQVNPLPR